MLQTGLDGKHEHGNPDIPASRLQLHEQQPEIIADDLDHAQSLSLLLLSPVHIPVVRWFGHSLIDQLFSSGREVALWLGRFRAFVGPMAVYVIATMEGKRGSSVGDGEAR